MVLRMAVVLEMAVATVEQEEEAVVGAKVVIQVEVEEHLHTGSAHYGIEELGRRRRFWM